MMIFIYGNNLYYGLKYLGIGKINFSNLLKLLSKDKLLISIFYYNAPLNISINKNKYWKLHLSRKRR